MCQTVGVTIESTTLQLPLTTVLALAAGQQPQALPALALPASLGSDLQGGIYVGPVAESGKIAHLIAAKETLTKAEWNDAIKSGSGYAGGGQSDWRLPTKEEAMVAVIHAPDKFEKARYWTSTPYGSTSAWALDFEYGYVYSWYRCSEFLVRPFRRFTY